MGGRNKMKTNNDKEDANISQNAILESRHVAGYTALRYRINNGNTDNPATMNDTMSGWLYLRKQDDDKLFIGNLPWPVWLPFADTLSSLTSSQLKPVQTIVGHMVPESKSEEGSIDVFSTGNGRLAARITVNEQTSIESILDNPCDHLYLHDGLVRLYSHGNILDRLVKEHERARDVEAVQAWSDAAMKTYERAEQLKAHQLEQRRKKYVVDTDEDGFTMVTDGAPQMKAGELAKLGQPLSLAPVSHSRKSTGKRKRAINEGKDVDNGGGGEELLQMGKGIEQSGFYRWQRRDEAALTQLQSKFRDDQQRIAAIRGLGEGGLR